MENKEIIRKALEEGRVYSIEFYKDGSGVAFYEKHEDCGRGTTARYSVKMMDAIELMSGFRFTQHEFKTCM